MKRQLMIASALVLLAACNKPHNDTGANSDSQAVPSGAATAENVPPSGMPEANPAATVPTPANESAAPDFVQKAAISDLFEVQAGKIALERASSPEVKAFARMMIHDHTKSTAELKAAIASSGQTLTVPTDLPDDKTSALQDLTKVDAKDFDKKYIDGQVDGHQQALDLMARYGNDGDVADLKAIALKTGPVVQKHLDRAKAIKKSLS